MADEEIEFRIERDTKGEVRGLLRSTDSAGSGELSG